MGLVHWGSVAAICLAIALNGVAADYSGEGTYYGDNGWEGYCKGNILSKGGQWPPSGFDGLRIALNKQQLLNGKAWGNTEMCGQKLMVRGTGGGLGGSPISGSWQQAMVTNMCPECPYGNLDFGIPGDGRWNIQWHWGSSGGGANHVDSASSGRAIVPQNKPAPKPKKKCDSACKKRNIRAALLNWRRKVAAARAWAKKVAAAKKYNARLRAARLAQRARQGRKLLRASA